MRVTLKELMDLLNVGYEMAPYETYPWSCHDSVRGETCSAEVRMGIEGEEAEAEIQIVFDEPRNGKAIEQVLHLRAIPKELGKWTVVSLRIRGKDQAGSIYDWETKCCKFFAACVTSLLVDQIPDFDELLKEHMRDDEEKGGSGKGGRKAPKARMQQVLGMKKGGSF
ncbi:MAG: hypothetical protein EOM26_00880 [Alphaproteobacteria bacterium]|nr:hypothetical protein [Alphaproteobacteria bacterium]